VRQILTAQISTDGKETSVESGVSLRRPVLHFLNPLSNAFAGSERRTINYLALLSSRSNLTLWAEKEPHRELAGLPFHRLDPVGGILPQGGTLVLVGIYVDRIHWLERARPDRLIIVYNTPALVRLRELLDFASRAGLPRPELVFPSETHRASTGLPGFVDWGLFDFETFKPTQRIRDSGRFTVGRMSRDENIKHHPQDIRLYRRLAKRGVRVRLMGASVFRERLQDCEAIEFLDTGQVAASAFLNGLDAFVYRVHPMWSEPSGRVVVEAMACELPVVVGRGGGYCELIEHGVNGFLFDTHAEAEEYVEELRRDPILARRVGRAARATVLGRFGQAHADRVGDFFLRRPS